MKILHKIKNFEETTEVSLKAYASQAKFSMLKKLSKY